MTPTRRDVLAGGGCMALALAFAPAARATAGARRLIDRAMLENRPAGDALLIPEGRFIDDAFLAALPPGAYVAILAPANAFLLAQALRRGRAVPVEREGALHFSLTTAREMV